jgi:hypothetical protein
MFTNGTGLLSGKDIYNAVTKVIEAVGMFDVPMEGTRLKLRENINFVEG